MYWKENVGKINYQISFINTENFQDLYKKKLVYSILNHKSTKIKLSLIILQNMIIMLTKNSHEVFLSNFYKTLHL